MKRNKDYHVVMQDDDGIIIVSAVNEEELFSAIKRRMPDDYWIFYGIRFDTVQAVFDDAPMPSSELSREYSRLLIAYSDKRDGKDRESQLQADKLLAEDEPESPEDNQEHHGKYTDEEIDRLIEESEELEDMEEEKNSFNSEFGGDTEE